MGSHVCVQHVRSHFFQSKRGFGKSTSNFSRFRYIWPCWFWIRCFLCGLGRFWLTMMCTYVLTIQLFALLDRVPLLLRLKQHHWNQSNFASFVVETFKNNVVVTLTAPSTCDFLGTCWLHAPIYAAIHLSRRATEYHAIFIASSITQGVAMGLIFFLFVCECWFFVMYLATVSRCCTSQNHQSNRQVPRPEGFGQSPDTAPCLPCSRNLASEARTNVEMMCDNFSVSFTVQFCINFIPEMSSNWLKHQQNRAAKCMLHHQNIAKCKQCFTVCCNRIIPWRKVFEYFLFGTFITNTHIFRPFAKCCLFFFSRFHFAKVWMGSSQSAHGGHGKWVGHRKKVSHWGSKKYHAQFGWKKYVHTNCVQLFSPRRSQTSQGGGGWHAGQWSKVSS